MFQQFISSASVETTARDSSSSSLHLFFLRQCCQVEKNVKSSGDSQNVAVLRDSQGTLRTFLDTGPGDVHIDLVRKGNYHVINLIRVP